jgi:ankyrin repeat protein
VDELIAAIKRREVGGVRRLLDGHPALAAGRSATGETPAIAAIYWRSAEILELLLARGARLDVFEAAAAGRVERVRELVAGDPGLVAARAPDGWTALHLAAHFRHLSVVELLLSRGADVNARSANSHANTALHAAAAGGAERALVQRLVDAGVDVDATQGGGYTGLHEAASIGRADLVTLLLEAGADAQSRTHEGRTAAELARANGHEDVAVMLAAWPGAGGKR